MAVIQTGLLAGVAGRVGQVVVYNRMGRWCVRQHVEHIRDARTPAQLRQRGLFRAMMQTASAMRDATAVGLRGEARAQGLVDSNLFLRLNKGCFAEGGEGGVEVGWGALQVSAGPVAPVGLERVAVADGRLEVRFARVGGPGVQNSTDRVNVYVYSPERGQGLLLLPVYRMDRRVRCALPSWLAGCRLAVYAFCTSSDDALLASPTAGAEWDPEADSASPSSSPLAVSVPGIAATAPSASVPGPDGQPSEASSAPATDPSAALSEAVPDTLPSADSPSAPEDGFF